LKIDTCGPATPELPGALNVKANTPPTPPAP